MSTSEGGDGVEESSGREERREREEGDRAEKDRGDREKEDSKDVEGEGGQRATGCRINQQISLLFI